MAPKDDQPIYGVTGGPLTIGQLRRIISHLKDDAEVDFGCDLNGEPLEFHKAEIMDDGTLHIELNVVE